MDEKQERLLGFVSGLVGQKIMVRVMVRGQVSVHFVGVLERGVGAFHAQRALRDFQFCVVGESDGVHAVSSVRFDISAVSRVGAGLIDISI